MPPDHFFHHEVRLTAKSRAWPSLSEDKNNIREREVCRLMHTTFFFSSFPVLSFFCYDGEQNDAIANRATDCRRIHTYIYVISTNEPLEYTPFFYQNALRDSIDVKEYEWYFS
jgi:hypothetical protein